jgi:plasmid replication initiation protein
MTSSKSKDQQTETGERQIELFVPEIQSWTLKDDLASMEVPLFSLSKTPDMAIREYKRGNKTLRVIPSGIGAANVFDHDLLIYIGSQIVEAKNRGLPITQRVLVDSYDFLMGTERGDGRTSFENIAGMLRRLRGTTIETNILTGGKRVTDGFGIIADYKIVSQKTSRHKKTAKKPEMDVERVLSFEVIVSDWFWNGLLEYEVLTLDRRYFSLTSSVQRRLYEVARKHCGTDKAVWKINIDDMADKIGYKAERYKFRSDLREIIAADPLPDYQIALEKKGKDEFVVVYTKNKAMLAKHIMTTGCFEWFDALERKRDSAEPAATGKK